MPVFKERAFEYHKKLLRLARQVLWTFALGLRAEETFFDTMTDAANTGVKMLH
jgi:isopenicillin N synthase-like dioxygenase